jgi:hypothetical protein
LCEDSKGVISKSKKDGHHKEETMIYKTLYRKEEIEEHELHGKPVTI